MSMPVKFRKKARSDWPDPNRQAVEVECFLEGPSFDREGNLWFVDIPFDRNMLPTHLVYSENKHHHHLANLCFGGEDGKTVFITESLSGDILTARMPVAGKRMYGLS